MQFPALNGNWIDLIIIVIFVIFFIQGMKDRFIPASLNLLGFIITYAIALRFYGFAANLFIANFSLPHGIANALGFFATAIIIETLYNILIAIVYNKIPQKILDTPFNKKFGFIPSLGNGLLVISFMLTLIITLPTTPVLKKAILDSQIGHLLVLRTQVVEQQINTVFGQAVNETMSFLTVPSSAHDKESIDLKFTTKEVTIDTASEEQMLVSVNQERKSRGLKELKMDPELRELSRTYAKDMMARGYFSHYNPEGQSPFDRMEKADIIYVAAGENLAYAPNVQVAHNGLMESKGHRENILSENFGHVGIGVIDGGIYGKMFVQEFTD